MTLSFPWMLQFRIPDQMQKQETDNLETDTQTEHVNEGETDERRREKSISVKGRLGIFSGIKVTKHHPIADFAQLWPGANTDSYTIHEQGGRDAQQQNLERARPRDVIMRTRVAKKHRYSKTAL